jgi:hypothetical protein
MLATKKIILGWYWAFSLNKMGVLAGILHDSLKMKE